MPSNPIYPKLSSLLSVDDLPDQLTFIQTGLNTILNDLYYRDLLFSKSVKGDSAFYRLVIRAYKRIGFDIPGTGFAIVLNPSFVNPGDLTEIPVTVNYEIPIIGFVKEFNSQSFSFQPKDFFEIISEVIQVKDSRLILETANKFIISSTPFNDFVDNVNSSYNLTGPDTIPYPSGSSPESDSEEIAEEIRTNAALITQQVDTADIVFALYLANLNEETAKQNIDNLLLSLIGASALEFIKKLFIPKVSAQLNLSAGIEFPRSILVPLDTNGDPLSNPNDKSILIFTTPNPTFTFSTESGIGYDQNLTASLNYPSQIGNTGIRLTIVNAKLDLSKTQNIPEATIDGRPVDFVGVFVEEVGIALPPKWFKNPNGATAEIFGKNILIGTGGISGTLGLRASLTSPPPPNTKPVFPLIGDANDTTGKFFLGLNQFDIKFHQNDIIGSQIEGELRIPGFKDGAGNPAQIEIVATFDKNGDFSVTAREDQGFQPIEIPDILQITLKSVSVGREGGRFFIDTSGTIDIIADIPVLGPNLPKGVELKHLRIWDDGQIELQGGAIVLPKAYTLPLGPVNLSVTAIGMGTHQQVFNGNLRKYKYIEFSAGVSINPGGVDARGDGVKVYFTVDNDSFNDKDLFVRIEGIGIDIVLPSGSTKEAASVLISGYLSMKNPTDPPPQNSTAATEYAGAVSFSIKNKISGSAAMRYNTALPSWIIDIGLELATPIPLGSTGLGIYGFRGLVGQRYVANREYIQLAPDAEWYQYYKKKVAPDYKEGITVGKFKPTQGFSLGAGISLATSADEGRTFSSKLFLLLSLPDVLLIQGQAAILRQRIGLDDSDPPFFAFIAITNQSVEAALGANYKLPEPSGEIATLDGILELGFFFGNSSSWYVNLGRDLPESKRIQAKLLSLFNAYFYLMLNSGGIRAGAGAKWELKKKFGPASVEAGAYIDTAGRISFHPKQLGGSLELGGYARIKVFKFKLGFSLAASITGESPRPFVVSGEIVIIIELPKPFKDFDIPINFTWTFNSQLNNTEVELLDASASTIDKRQPAIAVNLLTGESYKLKFVSGAISNTLASDLAANNDFAIPMDCRIDVEFPKSVQPFFGPSSGPGPEFGGVWSYNNNEYIGPQQAKFDRVLHRYKVTNIRIMSWDPQASAWVNYDFYAAATPLQVASFISQSALAAAKDGYWQKEEPNRYTKLSILAQSPLSYVASSGVPPEEFGATASSIFCPPAQIQKTCVDFDGLDYTTLQAGTLKHLKSKLLIRVIGEDGKIFPVSNPFNLVNGLQLKAGSQLEIFFSDDITCIDLRLSTKGNFIKVDYYARQQQVQNNTPVTNPSQLPVFEYVLKKTETILQQNLNNPVSYNDLQVPIHKVVITAGGCDGAVQNIVCDTEITPLASQLKTFLDKLAVRGDLTKSNFLFAGIPDYQQTFCNTDLYTGTSSSCEVTYSAVYGSTVLVATLQDKSGFDCFFKLELENPSALFDFTKVKSVLYIQHDPSHVEEGPHYDFIIGVQVQVSSTVLQNFELKGTSDCWPISYCRVINYLALDPSPGLIVQENDSVQERSRIIIDEDESLACSTVIFKICWLTLIEQAINSTAPTLSQLQGDNQAMINAINGTLLPLWRPETRFAVEITVQDEIVSPSSVAGLKPARTFTFGFKTRGTIGHYHVDVEGTNEVALPKYAALKSVDREDQFKLAGLKHYIDYKKSYPNADGNILNAKPLFYKQPKLLLFYIKDYVYSMLKNWDPYPGTSNNGINIELEALVKDPAEPLVDNNNNTFEAPSVSAQFQTNNIPHVPQDVTLLSNMLANSTPCTQVSGPLAPIGVNTVFELPDLLPLKLYAAIVNVKMKKYSDPSYLQKNIHEVHKYNFQTSRYGSFKEQIESYILDDTDQNNIKKAIFTLEVNPFDLSKAQQIVADTLPNGDNLFTEYADRFDRLMDGALRIGALQAAVTQEFNIVKDENTGNVLGFLVRNPEPYNDPKISLQSLSSPALNLIINFSFNPNMKVIFSKDLSKAFITNNNMNLPTGFALFTFRYFEYSGSQYIIKDTRNVFFNFS